MQQLNVLRNLTYDESCKPFTATNWSDSSVSSRFESGMPFKMPTLMTVTHKSIQNADFKNICFWEKKISIKNIKSEFHTFVYKKIFIPENTELDLRTVLHIAMKKIK